MINKFPEKICFRLTRKCNMGCKFCLASNYMKELDVKTVKYAIKKMKESGLQTIRLTGGEPTLYKDLLEVICYCLELDLKVNLSSNLFDIDNILVDLYKLPISVTTSIHGDSKYHDYITDRKSYNIICTNIKRLVDAGKKVNVHTVITQENYNNLYSMIDDLSDIGVNKISIQTLIPRERGKEVYYDDKFENILNYAVLYTKEYESKIFIEIKNLFQKNYYVFEPDGYLYLQKDSELKDIVIRRII